MFLIGSRALKVHFPTSREPKDYDLLCDQKEMEALCDLHRSTIEQKPGSAKGMIWIEGNLVEFSLTDLCETNHLYADYCSNQIHTLRQIDCLGAPIFVVPHSVLYSLKRSHRFYPRFFDKHIQDYHILKSHLNSTDTLSHITALREIETEKLYGKLKTPSLDKKADSFFMDNVSNKTFIHDEIHAVMAHREFPMFTYIKACTEKVACSKSKFNDLPYQDRIRCVLEEAYVIALERLIIPMLFVGSAITTPERAFKWALMRICTTLCSGWFREFALDNYPRIWDLHNRDYTKKFLTAFELGKIKRID